MAAQGTQHWTFIHFRHRGWGKTAAPQFAHACDVSSWRVSIFCTDSTFETFLGESVCLTLAKIALRLVKPSSVVGVQREAARRDSTGMGLLLGVPRPPDVPGL